MLVFLKKCVFFDSFCVFFVFLYTGYGEECYARVVNLTRCLAYWGDSTVTQCL